MSNIIEYWEGANIVKTQFNYAEYIRVLQSRIETLEKEKQSLLRLHRHIAYLERERKNLAHRIQNQRIELARLQSVDTDKANLLAVLKQAVAWNGEYKTINNLSGDPDWVGWAKKIINITEAAL